MTIPSNPKQKDISATSLPLLQPPRKRNILPVVMNSFENRQGRTTKLNFSKWSHMEAYGHGSKFRSLQKQKEEQTAEPLGDPQAAQCYTQLALAKVVCRKKAKENEVGRLSGRRACWQQIAMTSKPEKQQHPPQNHCLGAWVLEDQFF